MISNILFLLIAVKSSYASASAIGDEAVIAVPGSVIWSSTFSTGVKWFVLDGERSNSILPQGSIFNGNWRGETSQVNYGDDTQSRKSDDDGYDDRDQGAFAGISTELFSPLRNASSCRGYLLTLTGDGQRYKFSTGDTAAWDGIAWSSPFNTTAGEQIIVKVPFSELVPTIRVSTVKIFEPFNSKRIRDVQLTLSTFEHDGGLNPSFQPGPFHLMLKQISFY